MSSLKEHLNKSIINKRIDESLILGSIVCATCVAYAAGPILNTDFAKSISSGIGNLLSGIGSMFGLGRGGNNNSNKLDVNDIDNIKSLLKKDPDDLTGKEKDLLNKIANSSKLQKEFSNNELKKLNKILDKLSDNDSDEMNDSDSKELHNLLKKKK